MSCSRCGTYFCWLCRKDLNSGADHSQCIFKHESQSRPEFTNNDVPDTVYNFTYDEDNPFLFYFEKYKLYESAIKREEGLKQRVTDLVPKVEKLCGTSGNFLLTSFNELHISRCLLMNMYITLATKRKEDVYLIATQAGTLEIISDKLAFILDKQLNETSILEKNWILKVKNITRITKQFIKKNIGR